LYIYFYFFSMEQSFWSFPSSFCAAVREQFIFLLLPYLRS
jgi:hypothetical protein